MKIVSILLVAVWVAAMVAVGWTGMRSSAADGKQIVGVWFVKFPDAPFKYHMCTFHADGTMEQANPDAGDAHTSDSDGMGVWVREGGKVRGKFVEVTADRTTRQFVSRGEISFTLDVEGDSFTGTAVGRFYDLDNKLVFGPVNTPMTGSRVGL